MTLGEILQQHELDVAGLELDTRRKQADALSARFAAALDDAQRETLARVMACEQSSGGAGKYPEHAGCFYESGWKDGVADWKKAIEREFAPGGPEGSVQQ